MLDLYVCKRISEKSNKPYWVMYADFGYRENNVMFDINSIAEFMDVAPSVIGNLPLNKPVKVGYLTLEKNIKLKDEK